MPCVTSFSLAVGQEQNGCRGARLALTHHSHPFAATEGISTEGMVFYSSPLQLRLRLFILFPQFQHNPMGSTKSKPNSQVTAVATLGLNIELEDGFIADAGPGRFGDKKALDILQRFFQNDLSEEKAAQEIVSILPSSRDMTRDGELERFGAFLSYTIQQIPYSHPAQARLVRLIERISKYPKLSGGLDSVDVCVHTVWNFQLLRKHEFKIVPRSFG
jgi:hypothetical protein